jgi:hypothetical protein
VPASLNDGVQLNVPEVFEAFTVNVANPGSGAPDRAAIASPSGSSAATVKVINVPSFPVAVPGAVTTGAWSTSVTVITVEAVPLKALLAVNVTVYVPACTNDGVQSNVPDVFEAPGVNVAPVGSEAPDKVVIASPSGSPAVTVKVISEFSAPEAVAGAVTTGARSTFVTVIAVAAVPLKALLAVNVTSYEVARPSSTVGVQLNVPDVFEAFGVNTALFPTGSAEVSAIRVVIVSPSGSEAATVNEISVPSFPEAVAGAVTTGAWSTSVTVITVEAVPLKALLAVNVTVYVPACVNDGVQSNVPDVFDAFGVNVALVGSGAPDRLVIASPSGSSAVTVNVISVFSVPEAVAGAVTTGARSTSPTVITVAAVPLKALLAVNVTVYVPSCVNDGVHSNVPDVFAASGVNVAPVGSGAPARLVIVSPSGSEADTVKVISEFSAPEAVAGAVTTGARSTSPTVIAVAAVPLRALLAVNVTV